MRRMLYYQLPEQYKSLQERNSQMNQRNQQLQHQSQVVGQGIKTGHDHIVILVELRIGPAIQVDGLAGSRIQQTRLFTVAATTQHIHQAGPPDTPVTLDTDGHRCFTFMDEVAQGFRVWKQVQCIGFSRVIAFTADNRAHIAYPFGTRQNDWAHDLPLLVKSNWEVR